MAKYEYAQAMLAKAIEYDESKQTKQAISHYVQACESVLREIKHDKNEQSRVRMISRLKGWLDRAEALKQAERARGSTKTPSPVRPVKKSGDPLDSVAGLDHVKQALREAIILPALQPQIFTGERRPWKGILLYGPPGTGKSLLASTIAKEADCTFFAISSSDVISKYFGESEKSIRDLFAKARDSVKDSPSRRAVVFIDEIDALGQARGGDAQKESDVRVLTELLRQMDGVGTDNSRIVVIGATNLPQNLDSALRRRFERRLFVPLPGLMARAQLLAKHVGPPGDEHNLSPRQIAEVATCLKGYSGADIASVSNDFLLKPVRRCLNATHFVRTSRGTLVPAPNTNKMAKPMRMLDNNFDAKALEVPLATIDDMKEVLAVSKPSVNKTDSVALDQFDKAFGEKLEVVNEENIPIEKVASSVQSLWSMYANASKLFETVSSAVSSASSAVLSMIGGTSTTTGGKKQPMRAG